MSVEVVFASGDGPYQRWMARHPRGFVISTTREPSTDCSLHRAGCSHVSDYGTTQTDGCFTMKSTIKVCSESREALEAWVERERPDVLQVRGCRDCKIDA